MLTEAEVQKNFRKLFTNVDVTPDVLEKADQLIDQLRYESPLRHRLPRPAVTGGLLEKEEGVEGRVGEHEADLRDARRNRFGKGRGGESLEEDDRPFPRPEQGLLLL